MLAALLLLGLLPLAAMPLLEGSRVGHAATNKRSSGRSPDPAESAGLCDLSEAASVAVRPNNTEFLGKDLVEPEPRGRLIEVQPLPGTTSIQNFAPDVDTVWMDLTDATETIALIVGVAATGTMMSFPNLEQDPTTIVFEGLDTLPIDDVILHLTDKSGRFTYEASLTDAIAAKSVVFADALIESSVTAAKSQAMGDEFAGEPIGPLPEAEGSYAACDAEQQGENVWPSPGSSLASKGNTAICQSDGPSTDLRNQGSMFDHLNRAERGASGDDILLYADGADAGPSIAEIQNFAVGEDFLRISLNPEVNDGDAPFVQVWPSPDGHDGHVIVNGDLVAILKGTPNASTSDVRATIEPVLH